MRIRSRLGWIGVALVQCCTCNLASAADLGGDSTSQIFSLPDFLSQITSWNWYRVKLEQEGLKFTFTYFGDAFANPIGGVKQGLGYDGRFGTIIDGDLQKLLGWTGGTFHASIHQIHGTEFSGQNLDNLMTVSGIEAPPSTRLFNLWVAQDINKQINIRVGQITAAQEFLVSQNANLFVNSTFGWPVLNAQDLPSGGPAYPEATPGVRLQFAPNDNVTVLAAIFNGDPPGPGLGNPVQRDPFGLAFRLADPPFLIAELDYSYGQTQGHGNPNQEGANTSTSSVGGNASELPGAIKIGAWLHTGKFSDLLLDAQGGLLAASGGSPIEHSGDYALYGVLDQTLWTAPDKRNGTLAFFFRGVVAPEDRNVIDRYVDGGLTYKGLISSRADDTLGLAIAYGHISSQADAYDTEVDSLAGHAFPIRDFEAAIELTYQWVLRDGWYVQPNLQYIVHPGGDIANPVEPSTTSAIPNAFVVGTRLVAHF